MALSCPSLVKLHRTSSEWLRLGPPLLYLLFFLCASHAFAELALCCRAGTCWHCLFTLGQSSSNSLAHKIQVHILESTWKQMLFYTREIIVGTALTAKGCQRRALPCIPGSSWSTRPFHPPSCAALQCWPRAFRAGHGGH